MNSAVIIMLTIAVTTLVESYPSPGYIDRIPPSRSRFERSANPEPQGFGGFGSGFGGFRGGFGGSSSGRSFDFSYHPPAPSRYGSGGYFQQPSLPTFNFAEPPSRNRFNFSPAGESGVNVGFRQRIIDHDRGTLDAIGSTQLIAGGSRLIVQQPSVGLEATYHPTLHGTVSANVNKIIDGPADQHPSFGIGYEHTVLENKNGKVTVSAGVEKSPDKAPSATVGVYEQRFGNSVNQLNRISKTKSISKK